MEHMARPPKIRTPNYSLEDALAAALAIKRLRTEATPRDPDLDYFPSTLHDDMDVDDVLDYLTKHRDIPADVQAAELPYRAKLVEYQHQRDTARYKRRTLALLDTARQVDAPPRTYGPLMGLPSRQAVFNRRSRLTVELRMNGAGPRTRRETEQEGRVERWLSANRADLINVGELLVDQRDELVESLADPEQRQQLVEAIDLAGEQLSAHPRRGFAGAIAYAMFLLRPGGPAQVLDPVIRDGLERGTRLRLEFNQLREASEASV